MALSRACRGEDPLTLAEHVILSTNAEDAVAPMKQQQSTDSVVKRKIPIVVCILPGSWSTSLLRSLMNQSFQLIRYTTDCMTFCFF